MLSCVENIMLPMDFCDMYSQKERQERAMFLLEQVHDLQSILELERFKDHDKESIEILLDSVKDFSDKELYPAFREMDEKPAYYADLREAFDDKSINAVSIATPNHWHSLAAIWASAGLMGGSL